MQKTIVLFEYSTNGFGWCCEEVFALKKHGTEWNGMKSVFCLFVCYAFSCLWDALLVHVSVPYIFVPFDLLSSMLKHNASLRASLCIQRDII